MVADLAWANGSLADFGISERLVATMLADASARGLPGLVEVSVQQIGNEVQREGRKLEHFLNNLSSAGIAHIDPRGVAWVPQIWYSQRFWCRSPNHLRAWYRLWRAFPDGGLKHAWLVTLRRLLPRLTESAPFRKAFSATFEPHLRAYLEWARVPQDELDAFVRPMPAPPLGRRALEAQRSHTYRCRRQGLASDQEYQHRSEQLAMQLTGFREGDVPRQTLSSIPASLTPRLLPVRSWKDSTHRDLDLRSQNVCVSFSLPSDRGGVGGGVPRHASVTPSMKHTETEFQDVEESGVFPKQDLRHASVTPSIPSTKYTYGDFSTEEKAASESTTTYSGSEQQRNTKQSTIDEEEQVVEAVGQLTALKAGGLTCVTPSWKQSETQKHNRKIDTRSNRLPAGYIPGVTRHASVTPSDPARILGVAKQETKDDFSTIPGRIEYGPPQAYTDPSRPGFTRRSDDVEKLLGNRRFMDRVHLNRPRRPENQPGVSQRILDARARGAGPAEVAKILDEALAEGGSGGNPGRSSSG